MGHDNLSYLGAAIHSFLSWRANEITSDLCLPHFFSAGAIFQSWMPFHGQQVLETQWRSRPARPQTANVGISWLRPRRAMDPSNWQELNIRNVKVCLFHKFSWWPSFGRQQNLPKGSQFCWMPRVSRMTLPRCNWCVLFATAAPPESDATSYTAGNRSSNTADSLHCCTFRDTAYLRDLQGSREKCWKFTP